MKRKSRALTGCNTGGAAGRAVPVTQVDTFIATEDSESIASLATAPSVQCKGIRQQPQPYWTIS